MTQQPPKPHTILFLDHTAALSGGEMVLLNVVTRLDPQRAIPLVVLGEEGGLADALRKTGIEPHVLPLAPEIAQARKDALSGRTLLQLGAVARTMLYVFRLARFARHRGVDVIHANSLKADVLGGLAGMLARIPVIWHVHDRISNDYLPPTVARVFRRLCRVLPDFIITNSTATLRTLRLPRRARARVVHNGIVPDAFVPELFDSSNVALRGFGLSPVIGIVGRISPWKGQHVFIRAAALVRARFPHARFQIIGAALFGEEDYEKQSRALSRRLGLETCLEWSGFHPDIAAAISGLDILAHASVSGEPFGQVVVEGMMAGKPVVATRGGGIPEIVREGATGLMVPMGDDGALAEAIIRLLEDPARARRMGAAGRQRAEDYFTIDQTVRRIEDVYDSLDARAKRRRFYGWMALMAGLALLLWRRVGSGEASDD